MEEVLEFGVVEVRVDLGRVFNIGGGEFEVVDGLFEVGVMFRVFVEGKIFMEGRFIDLDDVDVVGFEIDDFVMEG